MAKYAGRLNINNKYAFMVLNHRKTAIIIKQKE